MSDLCNIKVGESDKKSVPHNHTSNSAIKNASVLSQDYSANSSKLILNPNFAKRPLPPTPDDSSKRKRNTKEKSPQASFRIDETKKRAYEESIYQAVAKKAAAIFMTSKPDSQKMTYVDPASVRERKIKCTEIVKNSNHVHCSNKENVPMTPLTPSSVKSKKLFKKIGSRKLNQVRRKSLSTPSPDKTSKEIAISDATSSSTQSNPKKTSKKEPKSNFSQVKIKVSSTQNQNVVKSTPRRKSFISRLVTPISSKKRARSSAKLTLKDEKKSRLRSRSGIFQNPFRQAHQNKSDSTPKPVSIDKDQEKIEKETKESQPKPPPPPKPARKQKASSKNSKLKSNIVVNVEGVKYKVSDCGTKLNRVDVAQLTSDLKKNDEHSSGNLNNRGNPIRCSISRKVFLEGEEFVEEEPGVLLRSRNSMTRQSITNARNRSINTILKSQARSKQHCMFFNKFGKCNKREKGVCPYIHDPEKVSVCRKFLNGRCFNDNCLLRHKVDPNKMPNCRFFLEGLCTKGDDCSYRHVQPSTSCTEICQSYSKGACEAGVNCNKRHLSKCPTLEITGQCPRGERCIYPHQVKKIPPTKPKRKSKQGCQKENYNESKGKKRAFDEIVEKYETASSSSIPENESKSDSKKRQKIDPIGCEQKACLAENLDDSGPYEEIDEGDDTENDRESVPEERNLSISYQQASFRELSSFMSMENAISINEAVIEPEDDFEERLI